MTISKKLLIAALAVATMIGSSQLSAMEAQEDPDSTDEYVPTPAPAPTQWTQVQQNKLRRDLRPREAKQAWVSHNPDGSRTIRYADGRVELIPAPQDDEGDLYD